VLRFGSILLALVLSAGASTLLLPGWAASLTSTALLIAAIALLYKAVTTPGWAFGPALRRVESPGRVALTFDDGPDPESTPALLEALRSAGMRATFFLLVDRAEQYPELARAIAAEHEVGLHGLEHSVRTSLMPPLLGARRLREGAQRLGAVLDQQVTLYRPPFGITTPRLPKAAELAGLQTIWCSVRTLDGAGVAGEQLLEACRSAVAGDIVLLHEGRPSTTAQVPRVLAELRERGLVSVTVGELQQR
jgi:peptidoglycan/xylan/chitin deacetylase (PgdA/CDA1 family)